MKLLSIILNDIYNGRNIDIYITVIIALITAIMSVTGTASQSHVSAAILSTLALVAYSLLQDRRRNQFSPAICADNEINIDRLCEYVAKIGVKKARFIQYSGDMIRRAINKLLTEGVDVELLLQHPDFALNEDQCDKMSNFQRRVKTDFIKNRGKLTIRYYQEPASVRAIKLDDSFLSMGWYTYRINSAVGEQWIYGHNNAAVNIHSNDTDYRALADTFDVIFNSLWDNAISLEDVEELITERQNYLETHDANSTTQY